MLPVLGGGSLVGLSAPRSLWRQIVADLAPVLGLAVVVAASAPAPDAGPSYEQLGPISLPTKRTEREPVLRRLWDMHRAGVAIHAIAARSCIRERVLNYYFKKFRQAAERSAAGRAPVLKPGGAIL